MALEALSGVLTVGTGAIGTAYSVVLGWVPKVTLFFWSGRADTGDAAGEVSHNRGWGVGISATDRRCIASQSFHGNTTTGSDCGHRTDAVVAKLNNALAGGTWEALADYRVDASGFSLIIDDVFPAAMRIGWLALGGADLTDYVLGSITEPVAIGDQDLTSLPFDPTAAIFFGTNATTAPPSVRVNSFFILGAAAGTTPEMGVFSGASVDAVGSSLTTVHCGSSEVIVALSTATGNVNRRASLTAWLSGGFRLNWSEVTAPQSTIHFLALKGPSVAVKNLLTQTDTTTPIVQSGLPFAPKAALYVSAGNAINATDVISNNDSISIGAATSPTNRHAQAVMDKHNQPTGEVGTAIEHDEVYINLSTAATIGVEGLMDVTSFDSGGISHIMDDADPAQAFVWNIIFGDAGGGPTTYPVSLAGSLASSGTLSLKVLKAVSGSLTPSGTMTRRADKLFLGDLTPSGIMTRRANKLLAGSLAPSGILAHLVNKIFGGSLAPSGTLSRVIAKFFSGNLVPSGTLVNSRMTNISLAGSLAPEGSLSKRADKTFSGSLAPSGILARLVNKLLAGSLAPSGMLTRAISKFFSGDLVPSGTLTKTAVIDVEGSLAPTGSISKRADKLFSGDLAPAGAVSKRVNKILGGSLAPSGVLVVARVILVSFTGSLAAAGELVKRVMKSFIGSAAPSGEFQKRVGKPFAGSLVPSGTLTLLKRAYLSVGGSLAPAGVLVRRVNKFFGGVLEATGDLTITIGGGIVGWLTAQLDVIPALFGDPDVLEALRGDADVFPATASDASVFPVLFGDPDVFDSLAGAPTVNRPHVFGEQHITAPKPTPLVPDDLRVWGKADSLIGLNDNEAITGMADMSGNNNHMTVVGTPRYWKNQLNGLPSIRFDGLSNLVFPDGLFSGMTEGEIFILLKVDEDIPAIHYGLGRFSNAAGWGSLYPMNTGQIQGVFASGNLAPRRHNPAMTLTTWRIYNVSSAPGRWISRLDGIVQIDDPVNVVEFAPSAIWLGRAADSFQSYRLKGEIVEFFIYETVRTTEQRAQIMQYLSERGNL